MVDAVPIVMQCPAEQAVGADLLDIDVVRLQFLKDFAVQGQNVGVRHGEETRLKCRVAVPVGLEGEADADRQLAPRLGMAAIGRENAHPRLDCLFVLLVFLEGSGSVGELLDADNGGPG